VFVVVVSAAAVVVGQTVAAVTLIMTIQIIHLFTSNKHFPVESDSLAVSPRSQHHNNP
jgi:NADPH-dependent curcumin reductase CurA